MRQIRESHILEFHRLAVREIYPCGGQYRTATTRIYIDGSRHQPPHESLVVSHVRDMVEFANSSRDATAGKLSAAAYALWRLNWIHPFAGGNGRTARALAYLVVCCDVGRVLPGVPSMPVLIAQRHAEYTQGLRAADRAWASQRLDVSKLTVLLNHAFLRQLIAAIRKLK